MLTWSLFYFSEISCDHPPKVENARIPHYTVPIPLQTLVVYNCLPGFRLIGEKTIFCISKDQSSGTWDKAPPVCEKLNRNSECSEPRVPGGFKDRKSRPPFRHGDSVTFTCKANFTMKGSKTVWCQANQMWGPTPLPICESGKCGNKT